MSERLRYINAIDRLIRDLKANGIWDDLGAMCLFVGGEYENCFVPIKRGMPTPTPFNFASGQHNRKTGLVGNGTDMYIDSNRNNNADGRDDQAMGVWVSAAPPAGDVFEAYMGAGNPANTGATHFGVNVGQDNRFARNRRGLAGAAGNTLNGGGDAIGYIGMARSVSNEFDFITESIEEVMSSTSEVPFNGNVYVFDRNGTSIPTRARIAAYHIGPAITLSVMDTILAEFMARVAAA